MVYGSWGGLGLPPLAIHVTVTSFLHSNFMSFWPFGSQPIFSPWAYFVPKAQPNQAVFWCWDFLFKTVFAKGSLGRVYQLNPTDFATS